MPIGSLLLVAALAFFVLLYLSAPFVSGGGLGEGESRLRSALLAERERILGAILELETDHKMGKVPEEVFQEQRLSMLEKGASVLRQLEKAPSDISSDDALEDMIAQHKAKKK